MSSPIEPTGRQERAVLNALRMRDICGTQIRFKNPDQVSDWVFIVRRLAARINDLRNKGWNIETVKWCDQHEHPESRQIMYRLVSPANHTITYPTGPIDPEGVYVI